MNDYPMLSIRDVDNEEICLRISNRLLRQKPGSVLEDPEASEERRRLYKVFCRFQTWQLQFEAIPLLLGFPTKAFVFLPVCDAYEELCERAQNIWEFLRHSDPISLDVVNPHAPAEDWRAPPASILSWAELHNISVPLELPEVMNWPAPVNSAANRARQAEQSKRQDHLKRFVAEIRALSHEGELNWHPDVIGVTKEDFQQAFFRANPSLDKVSADTLANDLRVFRITFKRGTKPNKNNALRRLMNAGKLGVKKTKHP